ncbi:MAG: hypothetical protein KBC73_20220 [Burkholderiaceae bacterium]|nr:hypothetical protein [Burkholderiaceae bacterium]
MPLLLRLLHGLVPCLVLMACSEVSNGTGSISQRLGERLRTPGTQEVDLGQLTSFGWDRFYVFRPGSTRTEVCRFIAAPRTACGRIIRVEQAPEGHVFMIFGLGPQLTHVEMHALANGRFDLDFPEAGLPRQRAVFRVRRSGEAWRLEPR